MTTPKYGTRLRMDVGRRHFQSGMSLGELMIGLTIGLVLVTIVLQGYAVTASTSGVNANVAEFQTNGRYALDVIKREVRHAALSPLLWETSQLKVTAAAAVMDFGCGAGVTTAVSKGLSSSNNANPYSQTCLTDSEVINYARGDVVTLRRLGSEQVSSFESGAPYARVSYGAGAVFLGSESAPALAPPSFDYALLNEVYFINSFTTSSAESPKVPALYRLRLSGGSNPTLQPELVASNVEHMQWQFAVRDGSGNLRYVEANDVSDWAAVVSARVWLLARASLPEPGLAAGSYKLGNVTYSPGDHYRRVVLSSTISMRNR